VLPPRHSQSFARHLTEQLKPCSVHDYGRGETGEDTVEAAANCSPTSSLRSVRVLMVMEAAARQSRCSTALGFRDCGCLQCLELSAASIGLLPSRSRPQGSVRRRSQ